MDPWLRFLSLFVLQICNAQPPIPNPPILSENFVARSKIFRNGQVEFIDGTEVWAHSLEAKRAMVKNGLVYRTHTVWREHLRLFDKHTEYTINLSDFEHVQDCTTSKISEGAQFPSAWGWLQESAQFEVYYERGTNITYPSWKSHTPRGSQQLVVKSEVEPVIPYLLIEVMNGGDVQEKEFYEYYTGVPSEDLFTVPPECQ